MESCVGRAFGAATVGDGEAAAAREEPTPSVLPHARLWGPVPEAEAQSVGALAAAGVSVWRESFAPLALYAHIARTRVPTFRIRPSPGFGLLLRGATCYGGFSAAWRPRQCPSLSVW